MKGYKGILLLLYSDLCLRNVSKMFGLKVAGLWIYMVLKKLWAGGGGLRDEEMDSKERGPRFSC